MKIYFAGAIRGGREKVEDYVKIVNKLEEYGEVLTKHVADPNLSAKGEDITLENALKKVSISNIEFTKSPTLGTPRSIF